MKKHGRLTLLLILALMITGNVGRSPFIPGTAMAKLRQLLSPSVAQAAETGGKKSEISRQKAKGKKKVVGKLAKRHHKPAVKGHKAAVEKRKAKIGKQHQKIRALKPASNKPTKRGQARRHSAAAHGHWERHPVSYARGRCEPQSLTYARERSGIMSSRTGRENGPLTWFSSESKLGKVSKEPKSGSVLILGANSRHGMPTGHVAYVETARPLGHSRYQITFSHTNYDRRCSLETDIVALYDSSAMTLNISSGAWRAWGQGLRVSGFIKQ